MKDFQVEKQLTGDPGHPIWSFLRFMVVAVIATVALWLNATKFDWTEIQSLLWLMGGMAGLEGVGQLFRSKRSGGE